MVLSPNFRCVRRLRRSERLELLRGSHYGFAAQGTAVISAPELAAVQPEEVWVVAEAGELCAALEVPQFEQCLRGVLFPMGGIAGVWCYPEYRNRGFVRLLMSAAWQQMRSRRQGVSMLCPFSVEYYAQFGYVPASGYGVVSFPLSAWQPWRGLDCEGWQVRRFPAEVVGEECLRVFKGDRPENP
ncbi:MAG: GNAT family N-acetyltransferase, partial [Oscillatoriales cyanobacterium SM2_2_1]|nr:GNAT family N-acetyltransferase [Oscillatoriales cyanobacterium SM2_2_1]